MQDFYNPKIALNWRTNLRTNLLLWPKASPNIRSLVENVGEEYDEEAFLEKFSGLDPTVKSPSDARAVRNTYEVLNIGGFLYKTEVEPSSLQITPLGASLLSFLGISGNSNLANQKNFTLAADRVLRAYARVAEWRAIWSIMRLCDNCLNNEELNRAMNYCKSLDLAADTAQLIKTARLEGDVTLIGPRLYEDEKFGDPQKLTDQRKAMNPIFLLAGAGGLLISLENEERTFTGFDTSKLDSILKSKQSIVGVSKGMEHAMRVSSSVHA